MRFLRSVYSAVKTATSYSRANLFSHSNILPSITNRELDHIPEAAFYMVGAISDVLEKADELAKESA